MGNLLKKTIAAGSLTRSWTYTYNGAGQALTATDPNGNVTTCTYDGDGRLATVTDALGHVSQIHRLRPERAADELYRPERPRHQARRTIFAARSTSRNVGGEITTNAYDRAGPVTQDDAAGRLVSDLYP